MSDPMTLRARVQAPVKEVRNALTDPAAMRIWLAEHAEAGPDGSFAFWGRHTPEGDAPHQRLLHADDRTVRFAWTLDGVETTTEFGVEEEGSDATIVTITQSHYDHQEAMANTGIRGVLQTYWCLALANLAEHLEGRELTPKIDFTTRDMSAGVVIDAAPEAVFDSLVDSEKVTRWFGFPIAIEPYVGGRYAMGGFDNPQPAKILELEPGRRLSVDWGPTGVGTWELEGSGGRTRLTLVQSGFEGERPPYGAWGGILAGLSELRRFHEIPDWRPIWVE
ncbi:SRPBCC domain-containing protein [Nonomuraea sp. 3-1Str]|uniref:SRPBCC family protein n=1 Tax=Nonomuraea sp. 3-1Str TaxID=2929801 RepID=UPI002860B3BD|nr:SRPBCC family protein [Nonomuraea sp. 3-1Str]MDR8408943.1 SRPBCC domain-containing protein [Nonomuraea sp. 3-1Str]